MKHQTGFTALLLFCIFYCSGNTFAAQDSFEIDLKDLRPASSDPAKSRHRIARHTAAPTSPTVEAGNMEGQSTYTVKSGDHLFLILMRHYGLSNDAAERLIPEVMQLNGIRNPKGLIIGQRLTIPLLQLSDKKPKRGDTLSPIAGDTPTSGTAQTRQPAKTEPTQMAAEAPERQVTIAVAPPCSLARAVIEHLGLLARQIKPLPATGFTAGSADLKLVVACDLSPEEAYTYGRLLALHNVRLLVFKGDEPPRRVIEDLADQLGFSFHLANPAAPDSLPLTYVFPAEGPYDQDVRLTIGTTTGNNTSTVR